MGWISRWRLSPRVCGAHCACSKSSVCGMSCCVSCSPAYQAERHFVWPLMKYSLFVHCAAWKYEFNITATGDNELPSLPWLPWLSSLPFLCSPGKRCHSFLVTCVSHLYTVVAPAAAAVHAVVAGPLSWCLGPCWEPGLSVY